MIPDTSRKLLPTRVRVFKDVSRSKCWGPDCAEIDCCSKLQDTTIPCSENEPCPDSTSWPIQLNRLQDPRPSWLPADSRFREFRAGLTRQFPVSLVAFTSTDLSILSPIAGSQ
mmetsp:Transcript_4322/g.9718  ORF Transcript_4322/g.9718 Transcript_4322/m.9718 type:complete len:113 (-) Transcript_4322:258-596(-)